MTSDPADDRTIDRPTETESLGSVFDRLAEERFGTPTGAREAIMNERIGEGGGIEEYNDERALGEPGDERE